MYSLFTPRVIGKKNSPWCVIGQPLSQGKGKGPGNEAGDLIEKFSVVRDWYAPPPPLLPPSKFSKKGKPQTSYWNTGSFDQVTSVSQ